MIAPVAAAARAPAGISRYRTTVGAPTSHCPTTHAVT